MVARPPLAAACADARATCCVVIETSRNKCDMLGRSRYGRQFSLPPNND
jgi:hypothetical protein